MQRFLGAFVGAMLVLSAISPARADDKDVMAVLDKAIKALGGEEKLNNVKAATWKGKGKLSFGGNDSNFTIAGTVAGLDHWRQEFEGEFGGNKVQGVVVVAGDKGWRKFGDMVMEVDKNGLAVEKRNIYLQVTPITLVALKGKDFKLAAAAEEKVGGKPAAGIKVTAPDGKDFTLFFDKEDGLPVKMEATVTGFGGEDFKQETTYGKYKEFDGIKKATLIENKRNGEKFQELEVTEFKVIPKDKVDAKTFDEPK
jgi:hypothetical protein